MNGPDGKRFPWGKILDIHWLEEHSAIVEYSENKTENVFFHPYVYDASTGEYKDTNRGNLSLDAALAGAIAYRHEGINHRADVYFIRAIGADHKEPELKDNGA